MGITTAVVEQPDPALEDQVRAFLARLPAERSFIEHDPRWLGVLRDALRHRTFMVLARDNALVTQGAAPLVGYLPLALVASRLFGRFLVSLPYLSRAGVAANDDQATAALISRAVDLACDHNAQYLELRHAEPVNHASLTTCVDEKVRMVLDMPADGPSLWAALDAKVRNQVRKGDKNALTIRWGGAELLDDFYSVFAVNMRDLGTPVYPSRLFGRILELMRRQAELAVVSCEGQPVAGALLVHDDAGKQTQVPSASCLRQFNAASANMWMYHRLLERAIHRGSRSFDFGRSSIDSGTYKFKSQWGARPQPTVWQYHVRHGSVDAVRPQSPRYRRKIEAWQKLPVWVTRLVGPAIVRGIP